MKNRTITTMLVAATALLALADAASAYYSPRLGRFLNRDPINEPGHVLVQTYRQPTAFIPRDPMENNRYVSFRNNAISWFDPNGEAAATQPTTQPTGAPAGSDCGIEIHQSPFCLIGGGGGGELGHTWLTWGSGGVGEAADCPSWEEGGRRITYINSPEAVCQKKYVNNKWHVSKVDTGTFTLNGKSHSCKDASCPDIKACLLEQTQSCGPFDKKTNNCRQFVDRAMAGCCLRKAALFDVDMWMPFKYCCSDCAKHQTPGLQ